MTANVPATVPAEVIAGDTWHWTRTFADYPAPTWTATIYFENEQKTFSRAATASGTDHDFSIDAATTAAYKPGRYRWRIRATDGSTVTTIESGWIDVLVDPASAGTRDVRSWARRVLDAVEATLEGRATDGQLAMTINGRSISRIPLVELVQWRTQLRQEARTEEQGAEAGLGRNIKVRFNRV